MLEEGIDWTERVEGVGGVVAECSETRETKQRMRTGSISIVSLGDYLIIQLSLFFCLDECDPFRDGRFMSVLGVIHPLIKEKKIIGASAFNTQTNEPA